MRFRPLAALCLLLLPLIAGARDLVVGQLVDYAGEHGEASRDYVAGAKVYFDSLNARGGINGMRIRHEVLDIAGKPDTMPARIRELVEERRADVLFGFVGDAAVAAAARDGDVRAGTIALFGPLAGRAAPEGANAIYFARPGYEAEVRQVVSHFRALQVTRFAVVRGEDEQARWIAGVIDSELVRQGLLPAARAVIPALETTTPAQVRAIVARQAQAVIVVADTVPAAEFIKRYKPADPGAGIVALSTVNHRTLFELLGPKLAHGVMITQVVPNPAMAESPLQKEHLDAIARFRDEPPSHLTLEGFIAAKALAEGLRRAGNAPTRASIGEALRRAGKLDLKGVIVDLTPRTGREAGYVDLAMIRRNGALLQ